MPEKLPHETWVLITPGQAVRLRLLPLGKEGDVVRLLTDARLSEEKRRRREEEIAYLLGCKVSLTTTGRNPDDRRKFAALLETYYGAFVKATVLLLDAETAWANDYRDQMKAKGHTVIHKQTLEGALAYLASGAKPRPVLVLIDDEFKDREQAKIKIASDFKLPVEDVSEVDPERYRRSLPAVACPGS